MCLRKFRGHSSLLERSGIFRCPRKVRFHSAVFGRQRSFRCLVKKRGHSGVLGRSKAIHVSKEGLEAIQLSPSGPVKNFVI